MGDHRIVRCHTAIGERKGMLKVYVNLDYCVEERGEDEAAIKEKAAAFFRQALEKQPMEVLSVEEDPS